MLPRFRKHRLEPKKQYEHAQHGDVRQQEEADFGDIEVGELRRQPDGP